MSFFITRKTLPYTVKVPTGITLISDLHIGAANVDYDRIKSDLEIARDNGDRININGDVFDAILPKDHKRFRPDCIHPDLYGRADVLDGALEMAVGILGPYADLIDMIGMGNHESAVEKYHATDMIARIIRELNRMGGEVKYGGYTGYIDYRFVRGSRTTHTERFIVYYHHGGGGSAPVSKGLIGAHRAQTWVDSDVIWHGHKHNKIVDGTPLRMRCPREGENPIMDQQVFVMTGSYMDAYIGQSHESAMAGGRRTNYSSDWGLPPQEKGGVRVLVKFDRDSGIEQIRMVV